MCFQCCNVLLQGIFNLSDAQVKDLMFLREVYVMKESELNLQQASSTARLQNRIPDPVLEVTRVASIGTELKVKAAECHKLLHRLCWAMYFGVRSLCWASKALYCININYMHTVHMH